nr:MAG: hypothetical protein [Porcellio scaber clopovirus]
MEFQQKTKDEDFSSYFEKSGWGEKFIDARALKICINQNNISDAKENVSHSDDAIADDSHYYAVSVKRPEKNEKSVGEERKILRDYLSSVHFLIAIDLKHSKVDYSKIKNDLQTFLTEKKLLPLYPSNIHYYTKTYAGENTRREFLELIEKDIKSYKHDDNGLKKDQRIVLNYVTDYYEDRSESFNKANIENLKKATIHSNFIFIKELENESGDVKTEERGGKGGEEEKKEKKGEEKTVTTDFQQEEIEVAVEVPSFSDDEHDHYNDEKITTVGAAAGAAAGTATTFRILSPNPNIPLMLKTFIEYRKCFTNKCINHPSLYALRDKSMIEKFFSDFLKRSKNYYNASLPEKLSTNVSGYRLAEDGSFSREAKEFNYNDFILFKKRDFENLKITLRDEMGNTKAETGVIKILPTHEHFAPLSLEKRKEDYMRLKEFVLGMNKQWIGEMYLLDKGYESGIIKKGVDLIFNVYSTLYKNFENEAFKGCMEMEKLGIDSSSHDRNKRWENPAIRKQRAKKLLHSSIKKSYITDITSLYKLTSLMGSVAFKHH